MDYIFNPLVNSQVSPLNPMKLPPIGCAKLFKTSIIKEHALTFPKGVIYEDNYWNFMICCHSKKCSAVKEKLYFYREDNSNSVMKKSQFEGDRKYDIIKICCLLYDELKKCQNIYLLNILNQFLKSKLYFLECVHHISLDNPELHCELKKYLEKSDIASYISTPKEVV